MKKNKMMRLASGLLVAVLITTSMISGTFAKYVTTASASDKARVAKWGVEVAAEGSLFAETYKDTPTTESSIQTVVSSESDVNVVAPGTKNDTGIKFTLTGKPEVDVNVSITVEDVKEVFLKAGTYANMTTGNEDDTFKFEDDYYPVVFKLSNSEGTELAKGRLSVIKEYLEGLSKNYVANTELNSSALGPNIDGEYVLTWAWEYGNADKITEADQKDTLLGSLAADSELQAKWVVGKTTSRFYPMAVGQEYCNDISLKVTITVTQID